MEPGELLDAELDTPEARLALELAREDRKLLADLVELRKRLGVAQEALADRLGISQATVSGLERVGNDPKLSTVRRYARGLGVMIRHHVDDSGVVEGSESLAHLSKDGISTTQTAAAMAAAERTSRDQDPVEKQWSSEESLDSVMRSAIEHGVKS